MSIVITYNEATDITSSVVLAEASFISQVNAQPGQCTFKVRDPNRDKTFITGKRLTLDIDGDRVWSGYITAVKRYYPFADCAPATRMLLIEGLDINILFHKRFVEFQSTPTRMLGPTYAVNTADTTTIADLVSDWLDLSGDDLDTSSLVDNVGNVNVDQTWQGWQGGWDWASAMATIARLTQAIWYIDPDRNLVYTDVDTPTAPYQLSDVGVGAGYRELELLHDGSNLVNDTLQWGVGGGSPLPVFKRLTDASSVATHGIWQTGQQNSGVFKQATVNKIADSIINGSPLSKRGGKNDRVSVTISTFQDGFLPAQKVTFTSAAHGFSDVIPIRRMEITFPGGHPKYKLTLSHEIDQPFNLIDIIPIPQNNGNLPRGKDIGDPPVTTGECDCLAHYQLYDTYNRTVSDGWGSTEAPGTIQPYEFDSYAGFEVEPNFATIHFASAPENSTFQNLPFPVAPAINLNAHWIFHTGAFSSSRQTVVEFNLGGLLIMFGRNASGSSHADDLASFNSGNDSDDFTHSLSLNSATPVHVRITSDGPGESASVFLWADGDPEPSSPNSTITTDLGDPFDKFRVTISRQASTQDWDVEMEGLLDIQFDYDRCAAFKFDDFNRVGGGDSWGTASSGDVWNSFGSDGTLSVDQRGLYDTDEGDSRAQTIDGCPTDAAGFTMTFLFGASDIPNNGNDAVFFDIEDDADFNSAILISMGNNAGSPNDGEIIVYGSDGFTELQRNGWVDGETYKAKWEYIPGGTNSLKTWVASDPEPGAWDVQIGNSTGGPLSGTLFVGLANDTNHGAFPSQIFMDDIDFDYDGKPCFQDCSGGTPNVFDDFNRTETDTWGTPSNPPFDFPYSDFGSCTIGVDGDRAFSTCTSSQVLQEVWQDAGQPNMPWGGAFTFSTTWEYDTAIPAGEFVDVGYLTIENTTDEVVTLGFYLDDDVSFSELYIEGPVGFGEYFLPSNPPPNTPVNLKWEFDPNGDSRAKVWWGTDPEPDWQVTASDTWTSSTDKRLIIRNDQGYTVTQYFGDLIFGGDCEDVLPSEPSAPLTGPWRENATRIDATHYQLSRAFLADSSYVWVDGFIKTRNIIYIEDPDAGQIVFFSDPGSTTTVTVRYDANGLPT